MNDSIELQQQQVTPPGMIFQEARKALTKLAGEWEIDVQTTETRRRARDIDVDNEALVAGKTLKSDEALIPIRVINSNIRREQPAYMAFITQSWRLGIFTSITNPTKQTLNLEKVFTKGLRYPGWEIVPFRVIDGAQLHGWDSLEIEYDETKPLHVGWDHIGHENLFFPKFARNLEYVEQIMRRYEFTGYQLKAFVKTKGFSQEQVDCLLQTRQARIEAGFEEKFEVFKVYRKDSEGIVWVAWASLNTACQDWLKVPERLWLGRTKIEKQMVSSVQVVSGIPIEVPMEQPVTVKVYEDSYPIKLYLYNMTEKEELTSNFGRAFEDQPAQDAQTSLWTSFVAGTIRATSVFGSPSQPLNSGAGVKQTELSLEHGRLYDAPINFWSLPYPPMTIIDAASRLDTAKQNETGQVAYAALTRKDTEKTATELTMAKDQAQLLSTVQITLLATWMRQVLTQSWLIVQSLATKGEITLPGIPMEDVVDLYDIESSGSVDVVEREKKLQRRSQLWPLIQGTALAQEFLADILRESLPEDADRYIAKMQATNPNKEMLKQVMNVLQSIIIDPATGVIKPEYKANEAQFTELATQVGQLVNNPAV